MGLQRARIGIRLAWTPFALACLHLVFSEHRLEQLEAIWLSLSYVFSYFVVQIDLHSDGFGLGVASSTHLLGHWRLGMAWV